MSRVNHYDRTTIGGGCFWCIEAVFTQVQGVIQVVSGYSGGDKEATYDEVCSGTTGHAEVVQITYDPEIISNKEILEIFFSIHDPTQLNRQGGDTGTQYRSVIFYHTLDQKNIAEQVRMKLDTSRIWQKPIVTEITPLLEFYPAEDYHQQYFQKNPSQGYCQIVIAPKVMKFREKFTKYLIS